MKLIELHVKQKRASINLDKVCGIKDSAIGGTLILFGTGEHRGYFDEEYDEVMEKIREATAEAEPEDFQVPGFGGMTDD